MTRYTATIYDDREIRREIKGDSLERLTGVILNSLSYESAGAKARIINNATQKTELLCEKRDI